jgi:hypothetical protein
MKTISKLASLSILFFFLTASATFAADDGNTKPRLTLGGTFTGTTTDILNETSVSGNVKGVSCHFPNSASGSLIFTVNGATAQTISLPAGVPDPDGARHTGWIPMNIRFTSSIRIQVSGNGTIECDVSWALD